MHDTCDGNFLLASVAIDLLYAKYKDWPFGKDLAISISNEVLPEPATADTAVTPSLSLMWASMVRCSLVKFKTYFFANKLAAGADADILGAAGALVPLFLVASASCQIATASAVTGALYAGLSA